MEKTEKQKLLILAPSMQLSDTLIQIITYEL